MSFESRITWEKVSLELDLLNSEAPNSLAPLLLGVNSILWPQEELDLTFRKLSQLGFELLTRVQDRTEAERLNELNRFFFNDQGFQIIAKQEQNKEEDLLLQSVLRRRQGLPLPIGLLYLHLASQLDLPIHLVDLPQHNILKWIRSGKANFIDLADNGRILSENELVDLANKNLVAPPEGSAGANSPCFEILPAKKTMMIYVEDLIQLYEREKKDEQLLIALNIAFKLEPSALKTLHRRALLLRDMGRHKEALADIKRYFSFINKNQAPTDLRMAFFELQTLTMTAPNEWLH